MKIFNITRMDCYIYYKSTTSREQSVIAAASAVLGTVACSGVTGSLQRRPDVAQGLHTWMEVYHEIPDDFIDLIAVAVATTPLTDLIEGLRHMEFFMPVALCV